MTLQPEEGDTEQHELPAAPTKAVVQTMESQMECRWKRLDAVHQAAALQLGWVRSYPASATQYHAKHSHLTQAYERLCSPWCISDGERLGRREVASVELDGTLPGGTVCR
jgi:hypothetical protein